MIFLRWEAFIAMFVYICLPYNIVRMRIAV